MIWEDFETLTKMKTGESPTVKDIYDFFLSKFDTEHGLQRDINTGVNTSFEGLSKNLGHTRLAVDRLEREISAIQDGQDDLG